MLRKSIQITLTIVLAIGLVACGGRYSVPGNVLKDAIAISVNQTEQQISQELKLSAVPKVSIDRVKITEQTPQKIQGIDGFHVKGVYDFTLKLPKRQETQADNSFDLYLQRKTEGKTQLWQLAQRGEEDWILQALRSR
ncbi:MAG: hypothetical protein MUC48_20230 [Leptolyngbya sp. Prado105]|jgi:hypothetical protein|nr:hypothetical protein [Leptolyngbya sp. Prado105]